MKNLTVNLENCLLVMKSSVSIFGKGRIKSVSEDLNMDYNLVKKIKTFLKKFNSIEDIFTEFGEEYKGREETDKRISTIRNQRNLPPI
jgi:tRNA A-37 threonylcarbamoyl transferase component Bud32